MLHGKQESPAPSVHTDPPPQHSGLVSRSGHKSEHLWLKACSAHWPGQERVGSACAKAPMWPPVIQVPATWGDSKGARGPHDRGGGGQKTALFSFIRDVLVALRWLAGFDPPLPPPPPKQSTRVRLQGEVQTRLEADEGGALTFSFHAAKGSLSLLQGQTMRLPLTPTPEVMPLQKIPVCPGEVSLACSAIVLCFLDI